MLPEEKKGFTLIELLVNIAIIILIFGATLAGYFSGQKVYRVSQAVQQLSSNLRRVQTLALAGNTQNSAKGFGIYVLDNFTYLLFYNTSASLVYQPSQSQEIGRVILPAQTRFSSSNFSVYFVPPDPTTYINGVAGGSRDFVIEGVGGGFSKTVRVYSSGLIDVQ